MSRITQFVQRMKHRLLGPPRTGSYRQFTHTLAFLQPRDLPLFSFEVIRWMLIDPTVRLALAMRAAPLYTAEFAYKEGDDWVEGVKSDNQEVAEFLDRQIKVIWQRHLHKILNAQIWGWSSGEVSYKLDSDRRVCIDRLLGRFARDTYALTVNGKVVGTRFMRVQEVGQVDLFFPKCWWHAYDPESESPYGNSILRGAYSSWADKWLNHGALDVRRTFMHADAYGGATMRYPPGTTNIEGKGEVPNRDIAREQVEQLQSGNVIVQPSVAEGEPDWQLERATVPASPTHILDYPKDLDTEIMRGMEIPDDVITSDASGAWQGKQVPMLAFFVNADRWLQQVIGILTEQIFEPLVMLNWGKAIEFEISTKPLAEQAMEQMRGESATAGDEVQVTGQPGQAPEVQVTQQRTSNPVQLPLARRMSWSDDPDAELLVGRGVLSAAEMIKAARNYLDSGGTNGNGKA